MTSATLTRPGTSGPTSGAATPADAGRRVVYPLGWLRAVAALAVVTFHAYQHDRSGPDGAWPFTGPAHQLMLGTDLFVDMFFVLSGVVLWLPVARAVVDRRPLRPGRVLLLRRMARLLPLYLTVVLVVWSVTNPALPGHWQDLLLHLTFTHVYSDSYIFWTDGPAWSLAVEFHFYVLVALLVPVMGAAARRLERRSSRVALLAGVPALLVVTTLGYLGWAAAADIDHTRWSIWFSAPSRAADFGVGMLLATLAASGVRLGRATRAALAVLGVVATVALAAVRPVDTVTGEWWHPAWSLTLGVALASVVLHDGPWPRALSWRPLAWLGGLGYGIYLVHEPVMRWLDSMGVLPEPRTGLLFLVTAVLVAVPAVALAWLSSVTVEAAGLRLLRLMERDGAPRDYYPHLAEEGAVSDPASPATTTRGTTATSRAG